MDLRNIKNKMMATAAIAVLAFGVGNVANAQTVTQSMGVSFITDVGLTIGASTDIDFGTWVIDIQDAETLTIVVPPTLGGAAPTVAAPTLTVAGPTGGQDSLAVNTVPSTNSGSVSITAPIANTAQIRGVITTDLSSTALTLNTLTYTTATEAPTAVPAAFGAPVVTITAPATAEEIAIGASLAISAAVAPATTFDDAVIDLFFRY